MSQIPAVADDWYKAANFLPLGLSPGPSSPKDMDSFLVPFLDELESLNDGVPAYDAHTESVFTLKAHLVLITGDSPGIAKILHLKGHISKYPCRCCKLKGTPYNIEYKNKDGKEKSKKQFYFPLAPPTKFPPHFPEYDKSIYDECTVYSDGNQLPLRTQAEYLEHAQASGGTEEDKDADFGVKGVTPFVHLPTFSFPESCPLDVMHLVSLGFMRDLIGMISGAYFKEKRVNKALALMQAKEWKALGVDMSKIGAPVSWGRKPRDIQKYIKGFKAEDLSNFLNHYLLPLVFRRVPPRAYRALQSLVLFMTMATSIEITQQEIEEMDRHITHVVH